MEGIPAGGCLLTLSDANDLAGEPAVETGASAEAVKIDQASTTEPLGPFGRRSADRSTPLVSRCTRAVRRSLLPPTHFQTLGFAALSVAKGGRGIRGAAQSVPVVW